MSQNNSAMSTQGIGPYTVYQSAVDQNCWLVRFGTIGPVYEYSTPMQAGSACDALNAAYLAGKQEHTNTAWVSVEEHKPNFDMEAGGDRVLVLDPRDGHVEAMIFHGDCWQDTRAYNWTFEDYPYWMPLPPPPQTHDPK